jgi:catecholate siderophore receptor
MSFYRPAVVPSRLALVAATSILAAATPAFAQEKPVDLGGVTVTDTAINDSEAQTSYKVSRTTGAMRTDTPLIDVPQVVNIVTDKLIDDQAANGIADAIRYVPGVFSSQGENNRDTVSFRGNLTTASFFIDGIRDDIQTYRDLYNVDRLEVYKGPNAMIFGRGITGGLINRVTKVADGQQHIGLRLEAGSYDHYRAQADLGTAVNDVLSFRVTGVWQDSDSFRDGDYFKRWGVNPTVTAKLGEDTTISAGYEHFHDKRVGDRGVSSYLGKPLDTPRSQFFGDPDNSPTFTNSDAGTLFIEHRFSDTMSIRNRTRYAHYERFYQNIFPGAVNTSAQTNPAGLPAGTYAPGTIVAIQAYNNDARRKNFINQTDFNAKFSTGGIQHTLLIGAEYGRQTTRNLRNEGYFPPAAIDTSKAAPPIFALLGSTRVHRPDVIWREAATSGDNYSIATVVAGYIQDQIELSPMFQIVAGVRYEHYRTKVTNRNPFLAPSAQRFFDVTDNLWSPRVGLIFKPAPQASIYASYSKSYLPRGGDQLASLNVSNQNLAPETYQNYEAGVKWDVVPTFNVTAAIFQLDRDNVLALSDPNNSASPTIPIGRQRTRGVELSAQGEITKQLSIVASYTYTDAKFLDSQSATVRAGNMVNHVPKHSGALWVRYDPTESIGAAIGVTSMSKRYTATDNTVYMPGYTRVDGALYYRINDNFDVQVNVENLFDKHYFLYADSNNNISPGSPRAFRVALNTRF